MQTKNEWLCSDEVRRILRGSSCDLMHLREAGKLKFQKRGNAFLYASEDVRREALLQEKSVMVEKRPVL